VPCASRRFVASRRLKVIFWRRDIRTAQSRLADFQPIVKSRDFATRSAARRIGEEPPPPVSSAAITARDIDADECISLSHAGRMPDIDCFDIEASAYFASRRFLRDEISGIFSYCQYRATVQYCSRRAYFSGSAEVTPMPLQQAIALFSFH